MVFEDNMESPKSVASKARVLLENYQPAQELVNISNNHSGNSRDQVRNWKPPAFDQYKCNRDVAVNN